MKNRIFNLIIIDESGSMFSIKQQAISGLNETIQTIRKAQADHPDQEHFVSLVSFNTESIKTIHNCIPASEIKEIDADKYLPNYGTPLYDAMGFAINDLRKNVAEVDTVLVTVITDGYENASREYSGKAIKALVEELKTKGWIFTYIGANQDAENLLMVWPSTMRSTLKHPTKALKQCGRKMLNQELNCLIISHALATIPNIMPTKTSSLNKLFGALCV